MSERSEQRAAAATEAPPAAAMPVRRVRRTLRTPLVFVAVLLVLTVGLAVLAARGNQDRLDPESYAPQGSHALAQLLRDADIRVVVVRDLATATDALGPRPARASLLVTSPDLLPADAMRDLADAAASTVLVEAVGPAITAAAPQLEPVGGRKVDDRSPDCGSPIAARAGRVDIGGVGYGSTQVAGPVPELCFRSNQGANLATSGNRTLLGSGAALTNERLDHHGNAAFALALLGRRPTLVWYAPRLDDPALHTGGQRSLTSLLPDALKLALLQVAIGFVLLALWRARRLGPVVVEPLPVVVRAAESTEGLARLYRRAGARQRAATELRAASVRRLAPRFGMSATHADPRAVTEALAAHTGRSTVEIGQLLYGATPDDDAGLLALTAALDDLEESVRTERTRRARNE